MWKLFEITDYLKGKNLKLKLPLKYSIVFFFPETWNPKFWNNNPNVHSLVNDYLWLINKYMSLSLKCANFVAPIDWNKSTPLFLLYINCQWQTFPMTWGFLSPHPLFLVHAQIRLGGKSKSLQTENAQDPAPTAPMVLMFTWVTVSQSLCSPNSTSEANYKSGSFPTGTGWPRISDSKNLTGQG